MAVFKTWAIVVAKQFKLGAVLNQGTYKDNIVQFSRLNLQHFSQSITITDASPMQANTVGT